jgi:hypothetical protein
MRTTEFFACAAHFGVRQLDPALHTTPNGQLP